VEVASVSLDGWADAEHDQQCKHEQEEPPNGSMPTVARPKDYYRNNRESNIATLLRDIASKTLRDVSEVEAPQPRQNSRNNKISEIGRKVLREIYYVWNIVSAIPHWYEPRDRGWHNDDGSYAYVEPYFK
jgi:hypothetical protein